MLLLRHASAGQRLSSPEIDRFRRLDDHGRRVARDLVWSLADRAITQIVSSPLARCVESVVPIAEHRGLVVESRWELEPDVPLDDVLTLLQDLPESALVCTHREVFERLLGHDADYEKGGVWVVEWSGDALVPSMYLGPPTPIRVTDRYAARTG